MSGPSTLDLSPWPTLAKDSEGRKTKDQRLFQLWFPVLSEFRAENEAHDLGVARGTGFPVIGLQILIVDAPSGCGHSRIDVVHQPIANHPKVLARSRLQPGVDLRRRPPIETADNL